MTSRIAILPAELADQIAAGEVVERPAAAVKELVENALDAGARRIDVEIVRGGLGRIVVTDDGMGMSPEDAHLALKRHGTSKLRAITDLQSMRTLGFRGEALPSIAAVSRLTLTTRSREAQDADGAYRIEVEGGVIVRSGPIGAPVGTTVEAHGLFANVPARLKFVKAEATEAAHVVDALLRLGLGHPDVHFRLRSEGRVSLELLPHKSELERARAALGRHKAPARLWPTTPTDANEGPIKVRAYLGSPSDSASTARGTYLFVGKRFVRDRGLLHAVTMGYGELLERGRYPLAAVFIDVPPHEVDINVHPQKLEVRFADASRVYAAVRHTILATTSRSPLPWIGEPVAGKGLTIQSLPPDASGPNEPRGAGSSGYESHRRRAAEALSLFAPPRASTVDAQRGPPPEPAYVSRYLAGLDPSAAVEAAEAGAPRGARNPAPAPEDRFFGELRYIGQLDRTYLLCEAPGELVLIDQHAAHERVAYHRLREAHHGQKVRTQRLLLPATVELTAAQYALAVDEAPLLSQLGFDLAPQPSVGNEWVMQVRALPEVLADAPPARVVAEVLTELEADGQTELVADRLDHLLATMACHSVVRAGDLLGPAEANALLQSMDGIDFRAHCPHGRPVLLRISTSELERRFGR